MAIKVFKRCEKKFLISEKEKNVLLPIILEHMSYDIYCENGKPYIVENLYYDTLDNNLIRQSVMKPYFKEKLRLRKYKDSSDCFLEIKRKTGLVVSKRRAIMTSLEAEKFIMNHEKPVSNEYLQNQVINEIDYFLKCNKVYPKVFISYKRIALFANDNPDFRITFDYSIKARRDNVVLNDLLDGDDLLDEKSYLMEVKIDGALPIWFSSILSRYGIYPVSFSKYGTEYQKNVEEMNKYV